MKQTVSVLFVDPQTERPGDYCPLCGGERYFPSLVCIRCERDGR